MARIPTDSAPIRQFAPIALAVGAMAVGGCSETDGPFAGPPVALLSHDAWTPGLADDPLAEHQPAAVQCGQNGTYVENGAIEIDTSFCNYLSLQQPTRVDLEAGDFVRIDFFHDVLAADAPAQAHAAILIGDELIWDQWIDIPNDPRPYAIEVPIDFDAPAGSPVFFHLHNHGYNTWKLLGVDAVPMH